MISWMSFDPVEIIGKVKQKVLIIQGTKDIQVIESDGKNLKKG